MFHCWNRTWHETFRLCLGIWPSIEQFLTFGCTFPCCPLPGWCTSITPWELPSSSPGCKISAVVTGGVVMALEFSFSFTFWKPCLSSFPVQWHWGPLFPLLCHCKYSYSYGSAIAVSPYAPPSLSALKLSTSFLHQSAARDPEWGAMLSAKR